MAVMKHQRVNEILAADSIQQLVQFSIGRCHKLKGSKKDQYAMDLVHPYRLVLSNIEDKVYFARIEAIEDYH